MSILGGEVKVNKKGCKKLNREKAWKKRWGLANDCAHVSYYLSSPFIDKTTPLLPMHLPNVDVIISG